MRWTFPSAGLRLFTVWATLALVAFGGVTYVTFILAQTRYFTARNFRILTAIGEQVDQAVGSQSRVFRTLLTPQSALGTSVATPREPSAERKGRTTAASGPAWFTDALPNVPSLQLVADRRALPEPRLPPGQVDTRAHLWSPAGELLLRLSFAFKGDGTSKAAAIDDVDLRFGTILQTILGQRRYLDAFDALLLASADGQVRYATSTDREVLRFNRLDALTDAGHGGTSSARFRTLAQATNVVDVTANGTAYRLFLQPCCRSLGQPGADGSQGSLVIAGLVATSRLNASSMTVSFTLVVGFGAVLLLGLLSWPFLKLLMMGETQRVTASHVLLVGTCSVAGIALLTVLLLNWHAYARFKHEVDTQLTALARDLARHFQEDVRTAYAQMECLANRATPREATLEWDDRLGYVCRAATRQALYETFALVDGEGMQYVKYGTDTWVPNRISLAERTYFREVRDGLVWPGPAPKEGSVLRPGIYVDSIQSWTNGKLRAVVAAPTRLTTLPVAMITVPMPSLIDPVVVQGFQFAVVDSAGRVLFHADPQRNAREDLFAETDDNRRLRAAVAARQARHLTLRYWGRDHRAYVTPLGSGTPYALVTFYDKQSGWELQQEWLVASTGFVLVFLLVWLAMVGTLFLHPQGRASWIWPHAARDRYYKALSVCCVLLIGVTLAAAVFLEGLARIGAATAASLTGVLVTFLVMRRASHTATGSGGSHVHYVNAAVLCLVLTAVAPAAVFFQTAHHLHTETYVKYRQLKLAEALDSRARRGQALEATQALLQPAAPVPLSAVVDRGVYLSFFYGTTVASGAPAMPTEPCRAEDDARETRLDFIPGVLEDWFPYQSPTSAEMRELLGDGGPSDQWHWRHGVRVDDVPCLTLSHGERRLSSSTPRLLPAGLPLRAAAGRTDGEPKVWGSTWHLLAIGALLLAVASCLVRFVCAKVFMIELDPPSTGADALPGESGDNEFIWYAGKRAPAPPADAYRIDLRRLYEPRPSGDRGDRLLAALLSIDRSDSQTIVIDAIDHQVQDAAFAETKLNLVEELVVHQNRVVILTSRTSPRLIADRTPALRQRWDALFARFLVRDQRHASQPHDAGDEHGADWSWTRLWQSVDGTLRGHPPPPSGAAPTADGSPESPADALLRYQRERALTALRAERGSDAFLSRVCDDIERRRIQGTQTPPTPAQVREDIDHRLVGYYRGLWTMCSPQEKLVLAHVAQDGLVNPKSRRLVRRLAFRKLIRMNPALRLMSRSFERFVLADERRADIRQCEQAHVASPWDSFRYPFVAAMLGGAVFLVVTQKELFDSTIASLGAVATTVPAVVRAIGLSRDQAGWAQQQSRPADDERRA